MPRPEGGIAGARLFRWQLFDETQGFQHRYEEEPLSRLDGPLLRPPGARKGELGNWHRGVDIACPVGTPIRLLLSGLITVPLFEEDGFGNSVQCDGARYRMTYGHLSVVMSRPGEHRVHGDLIGLSGTTGNSTGPHIHFELWDKVLGAWVNPWLAAVGV